jgi:predicted RNase H-like HicB family nuclease
VKYRIVLEYDPATGHHTATVPGLPGLFVDAKTERGALKLAKEGIAFYVEEMSAGRRSGSRKRHQPLPAKIVTVDV